MGQILESFESGTMIAENTDFVYLEEAVTVVLSYLSNSYVYFCRTIFEGKSPCFKNQVHEIP